MRNESGEKVGLDFEEYFWRQGVEGGAEGGVE
jgi:hypothetical protein